MEETKSSKSRGRRPRRGEHRRHPSLARLASVFRRWRSSSDQREVGRTLDVCLAKGTLRARPIDSMRPPRADKTGKRAYSAKFRALAYMFRSRLPNFCRGQLEIMTRDGGNVVPSSCWFSAAGMPQRQSIVRARLDARCKTLPVAVQRCVLGGRKNAGSRSTIDYATPTARTPFWGTRR